MTVSQSSLWRSIETFLVTVLAPTLKRKVGGRARAKRTGAHLHRPPCRTLTAGAGWRARSVSRWPIQRIGHGLPRSSAMATHLALDRRRRPSCPEPGPVPTAPSSCSPAASSRPPNQRFLPRPVANDDCRWSREMNCVRNEIVSRFGYAQRPIYQTQSQISGALRACMTDD